MRKQHHLWYFLVFEWLSFIKTGTCLNISKLASEAPFHNGLLLRASLGGQIKATVMTAVAMQLNGGTIVTVMTNLYSKKERMLVYVNSTLLNFTAPAQYWQQYPGMLDVNFTVMSLVSNSLTHPLHTCGIDNSFQVFNRTLRVLAAVSRFLKDPLLQQYSRVWLCVRILTALTAVLKCSKSFLLSQKYPPCRGGLYYV